MFPVVTLSLTDAHLVRLRVESTRIALRHSVVAKLECAGGRFHKSNKYNVCMFICTYVFVCMYATYECLIDRMYAYVDAFSSLG